MMVFSKQVCWFSKLIPPPHHDPPPPHPAAPSLPPVRLKPKTSAELREGTDRISRRPVLVDNTHIYDIL